jgi:hypothetical protein
MTARARSFSRTSQQSTNEQEDARVESVTASGSTMKGDA